MKFIRNLIALCVLTISTLDTIHSTNEPSMKFGGYFTTSMVEYNSDGKHYFLKVNEYNILEACPREEDTNSFNIIRKEPNYEAFAPLCKESPQPRIYKTDINDIVGYAIYTPGVPTPQEYENNVPKNHKILAIIYFIFDENPRRIRYVWYQLTQGKVLNPEVRKDDTQKYQKNIDYYGYDVDTLYSKADCPYVKAQLAPEEDFFFDSWKSCSRQNVLTAPMRRELLPQWQSLEVFIRKVTQITGEIIIRTGIYGTISTLDDEYEVPEYYWKTIYNQIFHKDVVHHYGIIIVMHNIDPNANTEVEKICPDDQARIAKTGWQLLIDKKFEKLIYGCLLTDENLYKFGTSVGDEYNPLDLHDVLVSIDYDGKLDRKNVLEIMGLSKVENGEITSD